MKYALWDLVEETPNYLTGPEQAIFDLGGFGEASWTNGPVEQGADILGYVTGEFDSALLLVWNYREISQADALAFAQAINPNAFITEDGKIAAPIQE
jgi:hypothetical protein